MDNALLILICLAVGAFLRLAYLNVLALIEDLWALSSENTMMRALLEIRERKRALDALILCNKMGRLPEEIQRGSSK